MSPKVAGEQYADLMAIARKRLDTIAVIKASIGDPFSKAEMVAFHGRKIVEAIAFGCLVAIENGLKNIPQDSVGQWNAEAIFKRLDAKRLTIFPSLGVVRKETEEEKTRHNVAATIEGQPDRRLSRAEHCDIYSRMHRWLHEISPYVEADRRNFLQQHEANLWDDFQRLGRFVERHIIAIANQMFFCVLRDKVDGQTKVRPLSEMASLISFGD